jgi:hypothetical protein
MTHISTNNDEVQFYVAGMWAPPLFPLKTRVLQGQKRSVLHAKRLALDGCLGQFRGARKSVAADRPVSARPKSRPASTTNRDSRPGVGTATGTRCVRDGVTGSAHIEAMYPSRALGLDCTEAGNQMEKVIHQVTLPQL